MSFDLRARAVERNSGVRLDFFGYGDLDYLDTTCRGECESNPECVAYEVTADEDCTLFGKDLFTSAGALEPFFDSVLFLTKCFVPEPLCDPETEVRQIDPTTAAAGGPHQMIANTDRREFTASPDYALTAAINVCRLQPSDGGCIGFAIEDRGRSSRTIVLLYNPGQFTTAYAPDPGSSSVEVYSIADCP